MTAGTGEQLFGGFVTLGFFLVYATVFTALVYRRPRDRRPWWAYHAVQVLAAVLGFLTMLALIWPASKLGLIHS